MIFQTSVTLASILSSIGDIVTAAISWLADFVTAVTGNPLLLMFVLVSMVGLGIGIFKRLLRL